MRALVLLLVASCGRNAPAGRHGIAIGTAHKAAITALSLAGSLPAVTLLDAGREPRRELRYHPAVGGTQHIKVQQSSRSELHPFVNADVTSTIELTVNAVSPAGEIRMKEGIVGADLGSTEAGTARAAEQRELIAGMGGRSWEVGIDDRGRTPEVGTMSVLAQLATPLPAEPVGVGARWKVVAHRLQVIIGESEATYELVAADGDRLTLRVATRMTAAPQRMRPEVEVYGMEATGTGEQQLDLGRLAPLSDHTVIAGTLRFRIESGEMKVDTTNELTVKGD